jgi:hypothetical protein
MPPTEQDVTMAWVLLGVVVLAFVVRILARRRRDLFTISRSDSISTMHGGRSSKQTKATKAALDAATQSLR